MIIFKMSLPRDYNTRTSTFGFDESYCIRTAYGEVISPHFGLRIEADHPVFPPPIVKVVEHYNVGKENAYIERLCYIDGKYLYPYRMKYITPKKQWDTQVVVPRNIEQIHQLIDKRCTAELTTPATLYVRHIKPSYVPYNNPMKPTIYERYGNGFDLINHLCHDTLNWYDIYDEIKHNSAFNSRLRNERAVEYTESVIEKMLLPKIPFPDPLTIQTIDEPISERELYHHAGSRGCVNFSQPSELEIKYPHLTKLSPKEQMSTISIVGEIAYSDLELEYILSNCAIISRHPILAYDRYFQGLNSDKEFLLCDRAVINCLCACIDVADPDMALKLGSDVKVVFKKTFNDEALFEIYTYPDNKPICAVHLDLAVLSLCSMGVINFNIL